MRLRLLVSLTHVIALEADYWLTGRLNEIVRKETSGLRWTVLVFTSMWLQLSSGVVIPVPL